MSRICPHGVLKVVCGVRSGEERAHDVIAEQPASQCTGEDAGERNKTRFQQKGESHQPRMKTPLPATCPPVAAARRPNDARFHTQRGDANEQSHNAIKPWKRRRMPRVIACPCAKASAETVASRWACRGTPFRPRSPQPVDLHPLSPRDTWWGRARLRSREFFNCVEIHLKIATCMCRGIRQHADNLHLMGERGIFA